MTYSFTRQELYERIWSEPAKSLAAKIGISDVALAKACRKAQIPIPQRGYWAKKHAGKPTIKALLSPRFPGASDTVEFGGRYDNVRAHEVLNNPLPPPPEFLETLVQLRERVTKMVGHVACPKHLSDPHSLIGKLLEQDEARRVEYVRTAYSWHSPLYDSPMEKRRLRILNAIFLATQRIGCKPFMDTSTVSPRTTGATIRVGSRHVGFTLEYHKPRRYEGKKGRNAKEILRLSISEMRSSDTAHQSWQDTDESVLEAMIGNIVVEIIVSGEIQYREALQRHHEWLVSYKAELEEDIRRKKVEAERRARRLLVRQEKERIKRLLAEATALQQADCIRSYVATMSARHGNMAISKEAFDKWASWALSQADRIDPTKTLSFLKDVK